MHFDIWKLADYNIIISLLFLTAAWRWGDWRNWQKYYPTILFVIVVSFAYGYMTYNQPLWQFESPLLKNTLSDIFVTLIGYSSIVLIFLPHYPEGLYKRIVYIFLWTVLHITLFELVSLKLGFFSFHNGWNIRYAVLFDCLMFPMLQVHQKKPLKAWIITIALTIAGVFWFGLSITKMK